MMKRLVLVMLALVALSGSCQAAVYYVSQSATNGYAGGVDTNDGASKATPFLTIGKARATYAAGDTICVNDGLYVTTAGGYGASSLIISKSSTWVCETPLACTIQGTNTTNTINIQPTENAVVSFGPFAIDAQNVAQRGVNISSTAFTLALALQDTKILNPTTYGLHSSEPDHDLTVNNVIIFADTLLATGRGINVVSNASGALRINGLTLNLVGNNTGTIGGVDIKSTNGGLDTTANVNGVTGLVQNNNASGTVTGVLIRNVPVAVIENCNDLTIQAGGSLSSYGLKISTSGGFQSDGGIIRNNKRLSFLASAGYAMLIGESSGVLAEDNKCNNGKIYGNTTTGIENGQGDTPHGIVMGPNTGGEVYGNIATNFSPAYLAAKTDATTIFHNNIAVNPYGAQGLYAKGATGTKYYNNTIVMTDGFNCQVFAAQIHSDAPNTPCSNVEFKNNIIYNLNVLNPRFVRFDATSTGVLSNNDYFAVTPLASNAFVYGNTSYDSLSAWQGVGVDTNSAASDPKLSGVYRLRPGSPCINAGVDVGLTTDADGRAIKGLPDIGAYEYFALKSDGGLGFGLGLGL